MSGESLVSVWWEYGDWEYGEWLVSVWWYSDYMVIVWESNGECMVNVW